MTAWKVDGRRFVSKSALARHLAGDAASKRVEWEDKAGWFAVLIDGTTVFRQRYITRPDGTRAFPMIQI